MTTPCTDCEGCGQVADTDEREPWTAWASLPPGSDLAVRLGMVQPMPCPRCVGSGTEPALAHAPTGVADAFGGYECVCGQASYSEHHTQETRP